MLIGRQIYDDHPRTEKPWSGRYAPLVSSKHKTCDISDMPLTKSQ